MPLGRKIRTSKVPTPMMIARAGPKSVSWRSMTVTISAPPRTGPPDMTGAAEEDHAQAKGDESEAEERDVRNAEIGNIEGSCHAGNGTAEDKG